MGHPSCLNIILSRTIGPVLIIFGMLHRRFRRQEILNFMTPIPRGDNFGVKGVKLSISLKIFFQSLLLGIDKINIVYSSDDQEMFYLNCKCHDPRGRPVSAIFQPYNDGQAFLCFVLAIFKSYSKNALFL